MSGKARRTTPATVPGAVRVSAEELDVIEPGTENEAEPPPLNQRRVPTSASAAAAIPSPSNTATSNQGFSSRDAAAKSAARRSARATQPGAVTVAPVEPSSAQATQRRFSPSLATSSEEPSGAFMMNSMQVPSHNSNRSTASSARDAKARFRTSKPATTPGVVAVAASLPETVEPGSSLGQHSQSRPDPKAAARGYRAVSPGVVAVANTRPNNRTGNTGLNDRDAAAKNAARRTVSLVTPGAVSVAAEEPENMTSTVQNVNNTSRPSAVDDILNKKRRHGGPATTPGAVSVQTQEPQKDAKDRFPSTFQPGVVRVEQQTTRTVAAFGMSKITTVETGEVSVPGAVSVAVTHVQNDGAANGVDSAMDTAEDDIKAKEKKGSNLGSAEPGALSVGPGAALSTAHDDVAAIKAKMAMAQPGFRQMTGAEAANANARMRRKDQRGRMRRGDTNPADDPVEEPDEIKDQYEKEPDDPLKYPETPPEEAAAGVITPPNEVAPLVTTADHGVAVAPELEYGQAYGGFGDLPDDDALAVAIAVSEEENAEVFEAIEYDPDSKPPLHKNRRFRLYAIGAFLMLILAIVGAVVGSVASRSPATILRPDTEEPTGAPTFSPSTARNFEIRSQLFTIVGDKVFDPETPQFRAATWIEEEDDMQLEVDASNLLQRYLLALFYFATTDNESRPWRSCGRSTNATCEFLRFNRKDDGSITRDPEDATSWLSNTHECEWIGNECDDVQITRALELWGQNITSTLPTELAAFPYLQSISLPFNEFYGTLPVEYAKMRHLLNFEVHDNSLTGSVPEEYYDANALQNFNIGMNMLTGSITTSLGKLTNLKGLHIFDNAFVGPIPTEIGRVNFLSFGRFQENAFEGPIPTEFGRLTLLQELWIHINSLSGPIPETFADLTDITDIRLGRNGFVGTIPQFFYTFDFLFRFEVDSNFLTGTLSSMIGNLRGLTHFRVQRNDLHGTIPTEIASLRSLALAQFHINEFEGPMPLAICDLRPGLIVLNADCLPEGFEGTPCPCCTSCCNRRTEICRLMENNLIP